MLTKEQIEKSLRDQDFIRSELSGYVSNPEQVDSSCCFAFDGIRHAFPLFHLDYIEFFDRIRVDLGAVKKLADDFGLELSRERIPEGDGKNHDFIFRWPRDKQAELAYRYKYK